MTPARKNLAAPLLRWFAHNRRALPWRAEPRDPYHVWLSEVMLQQTQVVTVTGYFERWIAQLPTVHALADAPLDRVLKLWEGLGYYARARNLHKAAQVVSTTLGGHLPQTVDELMLLPGVGRYTAGAIASLAFGVRAPVVDGNVRRVYGRVFALARADATELWQIAGNQLPARSVGAYNEALMELGAVVCTPRKPACPACPLRRQCDAFTAHNPEHYPAPTRKVAPPIRHNATFVVQHGARFLLRQRPMQGLLGGLWEFPNVDVDLAELADSNVARAAQSCGLTAHPGHLVPAGVVRHAFTHFKQVRHLYSIAPNANEATQLTGTWCTVQQAGKLALTRADRRILRLAQASQGRSRAR